MAAVVVVLGHVFALYADFENSLLYTIIFSFQIPLFMLVSGFAVVYSKPVQDAAGLLEHLKKRVIALLLPWFIWSAFVYFVFFGSVDIFAYVQATAYRMEYAFWFLLSLFFIDLFFAMSSYLASLLNPKKEWLKKAYIIAGCVIATLLLLIIGSQVGITFLGIKYTAYYIPYYVLGWLAGSFVESKYFPPFRKYFLNIFLLVMLVVYVVLILNFNVYTMQDTLVNIVIRMCVSGCGCMLMLGMAYKLDETAEARLEKVFRLPAKYSLELYLVQYFVLHFLSTESYSVLTVTGFLHCLAYFAIVLSVCGVIIFVININPLAKTLFFGKLPKQNANNRKKRVRPQFTDT